jgi:putative addiction module component (TIGR02574 family)
MTCFDKDRNMPPAMRDFGIERLNEDDRLALAEKIWESVYGAPPVPKFTPEHLQELQRRDAEMQANPNLGLSHEEVKAHLRSLQ